MEYSVNVKHPFIAKAEDVVDDLLLRVKPMLPFLARLFLVSTFLEEGFRVSLLSNGLCQIIDYQLGGGGAYISAVKFTVITIAIVELIGSLMILCTWKPGFAFIILLLIAILQIVAFSSILLWMGYSFVFRMLAIRSGLLLVLAESYQEKKKSIFAGLPSIADHYSKTKNYLQLTGRVVLVLMFGSLELFNFTFSFYQILQSAVGCALIALVALGYKTKLSATVMILWLVVVNFYANSWWIFDGIADQVLRRYIFFQYLSLIGGLIMVALLGPGGVSFDAKRK